jgi:hypothetical protein
MLDGLPREANSLVAWRSEVTSIFAGGKNPGGVPAAAAPARRFAEDALVQAYAGDRDQMP